MKLISADTGPFRERPFFEMEEIERICTMSLRQFGEMPTSPKPIRIDRFIEKRFKVAVTYDDLQTGVLGYTGFGPGGVEEVVVSRELADREDVVSQRRLNTTMAHEAGHGLLHSFLYVINAPEYSLFGGSDVEQSRILCRDIPIKEDESKQRYDRRWWEFQANKAMGALLLPRHLLVEVLRSLMVKYGPYGTLVLPEIKFREAIRIISDVFDVNPIVAKIRIERLYGSENLEDLTL